MIWTSVGLGEYTADRYKKHAQNTKTNDKFPIQPVSSVTGSLQMNCPTYMQMSWTVLSQGGKHLHAWTRASYWQEKKISSHVLQWIPGYVHFSWVDFFLCIGFCFNGEMVKINQKEMSIFRVCNICLNTLMQNIYFPK